ncbi:putative cross-wall-targeting lipoprotein signal domain-containing proteiin [Streptococcus suis]|uniref:putative cross-wall-targeting lipoprotein signal domain-containing proteiin n=1 Tax=Streptococcus suis TaxID=1307 RepID=UPI00240FF949|nr:putative cross-wall-targeting lipoprotein signal domain-containing proteiin [Streptococcus suis]MDG3136913.1 LPXTG cell wall anchor domain-containing protein [Streptococcus suis]
MNQTRVNGYGFFRKSKAYGLVCGVALGVAFLGGQVHADEVPTTTSAQPTAEQVAPTTVSLTDASVVEEVPVVTSDIPTTVPSDVTQDKAVETVEQAQDTLKENVSTAQGAGVVVKEGETKEVVIDDATASEKTGEVLSDLNKQDQIVKEATAKQLDNQKAYEEMSAEHETVTIAGEESLAISTDEVNTLMEQAIKAGLVVTETTTDLTPEYSNVAGLTGDELRKVMAENLALYKDAVEAGINLQGKSVEELKRAVTQYRANVKAFNDTTKNLETTTEAGLKALDEANKKQNSVLAEADKQGVKATSSTKNVEVSYIDVKGLEGDALRQAMESNIATYKEAVEKATASTNSSTADMQSKLDNYIKAMEEYNKKLASWNAGELNSESGIKWTSNTSVEASTGAERMTGHEQWTGDTSTGWAKFAIQGEPATQNKDATFNNFFKLDRSGGSVVIKNTSNGDVTLTISNYKAGNNTPDVYLVVWGSDDGGIAWGLFSMFNGSGATGTGGEHSTVGGGTVSGYVLTYPRSYDWKVETTGKVSSFTFNDIDNNQYITVDGINGTINKGSAITQAGNKFSSEGGDVSQGSSGKVDTNGIQYVFDSSKTLVVSGTHVTNEPINTSIVAGIFGVSSEVKPPKPIQPDPIILEGQRYTVDLPDAPDAPKQIKVAVKKATVDVPDAPEEPAPVEVEVQYYTLTTTPTPDSPAPEAPKPQAPAKAQLPNTGDATSSSLALAGVVTLFTSLLGLRKRKENE